MNRLSGGALVGGGCIAGLILLMGWRRAASARLAAATRPPLGGHSSAAAGIVFAVGTAAAAGVPLPVLALIGGVTGAGVAGWSRAQVRRRTRAAGRLVPEIAFAISAELRAGSAPVNALQRAIESLEPGLVGQLSAAGAGELSQSDVLRRLAGEHAAPGLGRIAAVWEMSQQGGVAVAAVMERLGEALDAELAAQEQLDAVLAGPRATALLLAALPLLGIGLGQAVGADPLRLLVYRPLGWGLCAAAGILDFVGVLWTRRILLGRRL